MKTMKLSALAAALATSAVLALAAAGTALAAPVARTLPQAGGRAVAASAAAPAHLRPGFVTAPFTLASGTVNVSGLDTNTSFCYQPAPAPASITNDPVNPACGSSAVNPFDSVQYPGWGAPITGSAWVGPQANGRDNLEVAPNWYVYDAEFSGCAQLRGQVMADNEVGVFLNGTLLADSSATAPYSFKRPPLNFSGVATSPGVNVVDFVVYDGSHPATGIDYSVTGKPSKKCSSWTVQPGGPFEAKSSKVTLADATTGSTLGCTSSGLQGTLQPGTGLPGNGIGSITFLSLNNCAGPASSTFTVTPANLPYSLNATSYNAGTGVTTGMIAGLDATVSGPGCTAVVDGPGGAASATGQAKFTYSNTSHQLKILPAGGNLQFWNVSGCPGVISNGDTATLNATYAINPPQVITSP